MKYFDVIPRVCVAKHVLLVGAVLVPCLQSVLALDPGRRITQYIQTAWNSSDGLPQNSVHAIAQTSDGYVWFGTEEGLARFDGVQFTLYARRQWPRLASDYVQTLLAGPDGSLWIGTDSGLIYMAPETAKGSTAEPILTTFTTANGLASDSVLSLCRDRDGTIWVGTTEGLSRIRNGTAVSSSTGQSLARIGIRAMAVDSSGALWIGTEKGLYRMVRGKLAQLATTNGLSLGLVTALAPAPDGTVWVGTLDHGIAQVKGGRVLIPETRLPSREVDALLLDRDVGLWIAFDRHGLGRLYRGKVEIYDNSRGLPSNRCTRALFEDREGDLWAGLLDAGAVQLRAGKFAMFGTPEGLAGNYVGNILQARDGSMWIGSDSSGLNHLLADGRVEVWNHRNGLPDQAVYSTMEGHDGSLWMGYRSGALAHMVNGRITIFHDVQAPETSLNALYEDREGNLWVGFYGKGLAQFDKGSFRHLRTTGRAVDIAQTPDGALWIAWDGNGVERIFHGVSTRFTTADGLPTNHAMCVYADGNNDVWAGTASGGLSRIRNGKIVSWTADQGLPDTTVGCIVEDNLGNLWMGGDKGIFSVPVKELERSAGASPRTIHSTLYGTTDGLRSRETLYGGMPSRWKDRDGRLWFATIMGAALIDPAHIQLDTIVPLVWIQSITSDSQTVPLRNGIVLSPGTGNFAITFTAPSFVAPKNVRFRYRLIGFDKDWIDAGSRREAWYTNLPPGKYTFVALAANSDGVWNSEGASFRFELRPPLMRTPLAYICYALVILLVAWGAVLMRTHRLVMRQKELTRIVAERTAQLEAEKSVLEAIRRELHVRATHDSLTGLFNRAAILEHL